MQITIVNTTSDPVAIAFLYRTLDPSGTVIDNGDGTTVQSDRVTISETWSGLDAQTEFKKLIEDGTLTLSFEVEDGDSASLGHPGTLEAFATAAALPAAADRPLFTTVWQTNKTQAVWTDGTDWRDAAGAVADDV